MDNRKLLNSSCLNTRSGKRSRKRTCTPPYPHTPIPPYLHTLFILLLATTAHAQPALELKDGDRVVFVGDGLFENELDYGFFEYALTTRWPDRRVTFRNIGWSGDTPAGTSRDHFTNPPTAYEHLFEQIASTNPTVVFVGYGSVLGYEIELLEAFASDLNVLLDSLETHGARMVLVSPIPHEPEQSPVADVSPINRNLEQVSQRIAQVAQKRGYPFVDLYAGLEPAALDPDAHITNNGIHLSQDGYAHAAQILESDLGWNLRNTAVEMKVTGPPTSTADIVEPVLEGNMLTFTFSPDLLPLGEPNTLSLKIEGLSRGSYTIYSEDQPLVSATARELAAGILIPHPHADQAETLRNAIIEKNRTYFYQYRPQNETYLVGFREYEQGQNARELDLLDPLIGQLENEIGRLKKPRTVNVEVMRE